MFYFFFSEFRIAFNLFDKDGGGTIEARELVDVLKNMGQNLTESDIEEMIQEVDEDGRGIIHIISSSSSSSSS